MRRSKGRRGVGGHDGQNRPMGVALLGRQLLPMLQALGK